MLTYLKHYYSLKQRDITPLALESWRQYIKSKKRIYNMDICTKYQRSFTHAYRDSYAKSQLANNK